MPYCTKDPKRDHDFENHPYSVTVNSALRGLWWSSVSGLSPEGARADEHRGLHAMPNRIPSVVKNINTNNTNRGQDTGINTYIHNIYIYIYIYIYRCIHVDSYLVWYKIIYVNTYVCIYTWSHRDSQLQLTRM